MKYLAIGIAGFFGAISRYVISGLTQSFVGSAFPWGTLAVNISGSFLLGIVYSVATQKFIFDPHWRTIIIIGFIGSYTTFATFSYETFTLIESGNLVHATTNIFISLAVCLVAVYSGTLIGRLA